MIGDLSSLVPNRAMSRAYCCVAIAIMTVYCMSEQYSVQRVNTSCSSVRHSLLEARRLFDSLRSHLGIVMFQVVFDA